MNKITKILENQRLQIVLEIVESKQSAESESKFWWSITGLGTGDSMKTYKEALSEGVDKYYQFVLSYQKGKNK